MARSDQPIQSNKFKIYISIIATVLGISITVIGMTVIYKKGNERNQLIIKLQEDVSRLEYEKINCRLNIINELLSENGVVIVDGQIYPVKPPPIRIDGIIVNKKEKSD